MKKPSKINQTIFYPFYFLHKKKIISLFLNLLNQVDFQYSHLRNRSILISKI